MIHASFDDFGKCRQDRIAAVAGYVAYKEQWERFNWDWGEALKQCGIQFLHTAEYLQTIPIIGTGGHNDDTVRALLKPFTEVVKKNITRNGTGVGVCVITDCDAYESALTKEEKEFIRKPDLHSFEMALALVLKHTGRH